MIFGSFFHVDRNALFRIFWRRRRRKSGFGGHSEAKSFRKTSLFIDLSYHASDADGDALTFTLASDATNGSVALDGPLATYVPDAHYHGEDSFTFFASDETQNSNVATIALIIIPDDDECSEEYNQGFEDGFLDGSLTGDANGDGVLNVVDIVFFVNMILNDE